MQDYRRFEPEALAADTSFQRWQLSHDPADHFFWTEWLRQNPDKGELVEKAACLLKTISRTYEQRFSEDAHLSDQEIDKEVRQLHQAIQQSSVRRINWWQLTPVRYGMAASLLLLLVWFGWYRLRTTPPTPIVTDQAFATGAARSLPAVINTTQQARPIRLPDQSTVLLYPQSRLSYDARFLGPTRAVYLSGKAYFNVTKNPSKPFYVYANGLVTKVLGTRFSVQTYAGTEQVKVVVRTGKVSVFALNRESAANPKKTSSPAGVVLTPNQQIVFSPTEAHLVKRLVAQPVLLEPANLKNIFSFKHTPIATVFAILSHGYGIKIIFDETLMRDCYLTASLSDEPLFEKLDLICHTLNARYEQLDGSIVVHSQGCKE